jgi:hypothetical protein
VTRQPRGKGNGKAAANDQANAVAQAEEPLPTPQHIDEFDKYSALVYETADLPSKYYFPRRATKNTHAKY